MVIATRSYNIFHLGAFLPFFCLGLLLVANATLAQK